MPGTSPRCFNPIEQYWAALREYLRRVCGYSFPDLKANIPKAIRDGCPLDQIQRYFRRADCFVELYRFEAENGVELAAWASPGVCDEEVQATPNSPHRAGCSTT